MIYGKIFYKFFFSIGFVDETRLRLLCDGRVKRCHAVGFISNSQVDLCGHFEHFPRLCFCVWSLSWIDHVDSFNVSQSLDGLICTLIIIPEKSSLQIADLRLAFCLQTLDEKRRDPVLPVTAISFKLKEKPHDLSTNMSRKQLA